MIKKSDFNPQRMNAAFSKQQFFIDQECRFEIKKCLGILNGSDTVFNDKKIII